MKKLYKKAMENLNKIILALVIFIILTALTISIVKFSMREGDKDICLISVIAADKSETILGIDCKIYRAEKLKLQGTTKEAQKKDAMNQIADLMKDCWYQFGEGKKDPFNKAWTDLTVVCFTCSKFRFETDDSISENEFVEFLKNKKISEEKTTTYHEYLKGSLPEADRDKFFIESINFKSTLGITTKFEITQFYDYFKNGASLIPNRDYGVVLYVVETKIVPKLALDSKSIYDIYVVPYENIEKLSCERLQG